MIEPDVARADERPQNTEVKVSVIIPTYNRAGFLADAVDSVLAQTWNDFEILVVDDGSTDDTRHVAGRYGDRIRYLYKQNQGPSSARNMGIRKAHGIYVAFLDSDDVWEAEKLHAQMGFLKGNPHVNLVCTDSCIMGREECRERKLNGDFVGNLFPILYVNSFIRTSTVLMAKACFEEVGYFDERYWSAEDYDVWLRVARRYPIAYLNQPLVRYRKHEESLGHDKITLRQNALSVLEAHYDPMVISPRAYKRRMSDLHIYFGRAYLRLGDIEMARNFFGQSLKLTPFRLRSIRYWVKAGLITLRE